LNDLVKGIIILRLNQMKSYRTVKTETRGEIKEKKSRFIGVVLSIKDDASAKQAIEGLKKEYRDARHYCFAYRLSEESDTERYGDDGEPTGTAGMPILEILRGKELRYILVVVIRYFGGIKLGTGGLARAYRAATREVLTSSQIIEKATYTPLRICVSYDLSGRMEHIIHSNGLWLDKVAYGEAVTYKIHSKSADVSQLEKMIIEETNGRCTISKEEDVAGYIDQGVLVIESDRRNP